MKITTYLTALCLIGIDFPCLAQSFGLTGGASAARFYDFRRNDPNVYTAEYSTGAGFNVSGFYEMKNDPIRIDLQYALHKAGCVTSKRLGLGSTVPYATTDMAYTFQQLSISGLYTFRLADEKRIKFNVMIGPALTYNLEINLKGSGSGSSKQSYTDTNGVQIIYYTSGKWVKDENITNGFSKINAGGVLAWELLFPVGERLHILVHNRYHFFLSNYLKHQDVLPASFLTGALNVGLKFHL